MQDTLKTDRLILRPLMARDAVDFSRYLSDWEIVRMTGSIPFPFPVLTAEIKVLMMQSLNRRGLSYPYAITKDGNQMIGIMDLFKRDPQDDWELGYWVGRPFWGNGYAPEAAIAVMTEAANSLGVAKFVAGVFADNPASMKVLTKIGFTNKGSEGLYFSMARLRHMESIGFELDWSKQSPKSLPDGSSNPIYPH